MSPNSLSSCIGCSLMPHIPRRKCIFCTNLMMISMGKSFAWSSVVSFGRSSTSHLLVCALLPHRSYFHARICFNRMRCCRDFDQCFRCCLLQLDAATTCPSHPDALIDEINNDIRITKDALQQEPYASGRQDPFLLS
jgi:hypothetical protein